MKRAWVLAAMAFGMAAEGQECRPGLQLLTVYTRFGETAVPNEVLWRARHMAGRVLSGAGVTVIWAKGARLDDPQRVFCGEEIIIAFEARAQPGFTSSAMAYARLNAGWSTEVHLFYDRLGQFPDRQRMPEFLGHVIAHEIGHILQGVARHSEEGVMKARWSDRDCAELARGPLPFAREDVELIRAHFSARMTNSVTDLASAPAATEKFI